MRAIIQFGKMQRLRFISHLDLQRFFQRALNRTGLPIAYSQGFNPHPIMAFGSALAVGWTSEYEIFDFKLAEPVGRKRVEDCIKAALPTDLPVFQVKLVDDRFPSAMSKIRAAEYTISLPNIETEAIKTAIENFLACEEVLAMRKTKSGEREINIRPLCLEISHESQMIKTRLMMTDKDALKTRFVN